jgi:HEAT repeat protein
LAAAIFMLLAGEVLAAGGITGKPRAGRMTPVQAAASKDPPGPLPPYEKAFWIWGEKADSICQLRTTWNIEKAASAASIVIAADNGYELYINGALVGKDVSIGSEVWGNLKRYDIKPRLTPGRNVIGIRGIDLGGVRGVVAAVRIEVPGRPPLEMVTDARWRATSKADPIDYSHPEYVEGPEWRDAWVVGPMGMPPWGKIGYTPGNRRAASSLFQSRVALTEPQSDFRWPEGLVFLDDDCSVYTPLRGDAWGVCFRINGWSRAYTEFDIPCPSKIGRKLCVLRPVGPGATPRVLVDAGKGAIGSPSVSYDGRWIYAAMALDGDSFFHVYHIPVEGGLPQQLTGGPFHDIDPAELPDGRIVFTSTRIGSFEEYHNPPSRALFTMKADGSQIQPITFTPIFDNEPKVMADGRIAFIRSDNFFDRAKVETQIHVIHPDGADGLTEIGADVGADYGVRLRALGFGSPAPLPDGRLACISARGNLIFTPGDARSAQRLPDGLGDLAPLPDGRLLATVLRPGEKRMESDVIAVIDPRDNLTVPIYRAPEGSVHSPVFLGPRPRPPVLADTVDRSRTGDPTATGFLNCQNVRITRKTKADWQQVRAIRVLGALALTNRSSHSHIVHAGHQTVELGTVPIAPDGSFFIEVPADMPIMLQAVDAEGRSELNEMSWIYVRPGERRSCIGCHNPRTGAPRSEGQLSLALQARPLKLLGQGQAHRFRGNNSGVTGMMDVQFERFRETASLNLHAGGGPSTTGRQEVAAAVQQLRGSDSALQISAAGRLGLFRDRAAAPALAQRLRDGDREVRAAAALALAACGTRDSVPPLCDALDESDPVVAQAAAVALENLCGHAEPFQPFAAGAQRRAQADAWRAWFKKNDWKAIEQSLIGRIADSDRAVQRRAIVALGHVGGDAARTALRRFVAIEKDKNPYPRFEGSNRTDRFTFPADSPLNPRTVQEAARALGYLKDTAAIPLLREILADHTDPHTGNLFLAEAAVEALGRIATPEAETGLIETFAGLKDYVEYVGWYSDHPALYACHGSPLHARIIQALDAIGSTRAAPIAPQLIRSIPTDPDRALFLENDDYETLAGRVLRRSGRGDALIETCLALLGDRQATPAADLKQALSSAFAAWAGKPAADNRAAQVLSLTCRDGRYEPRIRAAYERYRAKPEDPISRPLGNPSWLPQRHWVLFFLGRTLGNLAAPASVDTLLASLDPGLNEARHGRPDPSEPNIHFLQLEYTPCWRASAAWALGRIGDRRAVPLLLAVVGDMNNSTDVRHAAAEALVRLADPASLEALKKLAQDYPEHSIRRVLLRAGDPAAAP